MASILLVDDDSKLTEFLSSRLTACGYECRTVADGEKAIEALSSGGIDLLILDVMIPGISGFEVCRRIRSDTSYHGMPVMFMSSMNSEEEIEHGLAQGADDFLSKPFHADALLKRVNNLLSASPQGQITDEATGLLSAKGIKLEIHRALNVREPFSLVYVELLNNVEFGQALNEEKRAKALRHFARTLHVSAEEVKPRQFRAGHLGGGHFVAMISTKRVKKWCDAVAARWEKHLPKFYADVANESSYTQALAGSGAVPLLEALFCIKTCDSSPDETASKLLETLSRLRLNAVESSGAGVYQDRRH